MMMMIMMLFKKYAAAMVHARPSPNGWSVQVRIRMMMLFQKKYAAAMARARDRDQVGGLFRLEQ
jgi:hypothetical protein